MTVRLKLALLIGYDLVVACAAYVLAFALRFGFELRAGAVATIIETIVPLVAAQILFFVLFGLYRRVWRYASLRDLLAILQAVSLGVAASVLTLFLINRLENIPRSVFIIDGLALIFLLGAGRFAYRAWMEGLFIAPRGGSPALVVGAGSAGSELVRSIQSNPGLGIKIIGLADDDPDKWKRSLLGKPILGGIADIKELISKKKVEQVLVAMPSATGSVIRRIVEQCEETDVRVRTIPALSELLEGKVKLEELRPLRVEDLLGREPVFMDVQPIAKLVEGRRVVVTGAGGSIGAELCRQLAPFGPSELVLIERSEYALYKIENEMAESFPGLHYSCRLADICDSRRMESIFAEKHTRIVLHCAAYKHVPILELNRREAVVNNVGGTLSVARAAIATGVDKFVLISTDKAVNPISILGASKRAAELVCRALQQGGHKTKFITVRFGNVMGSSGSVISLFEKQIKAGGPVTLTHVDITRFFMSISEASKLVLLAASWGRKGEIHVLDMGEPVKVMDLARAMIKLHGRIPGKDIEIRTTGLRPGEKISEELFFENEKIKPTRHPKIMLAQSNGAPEGLVERIEKLLARIADNGDIDYRRELEKLVPEYRVERGKQRATIGR